MKKKKRGVVLVSICTAAVLTGIVAFCDSLAIRKYTVFTDKITAPVRLALLTDLHCCAYGESQQELIDAVENQHPDLVLLGGDILDEQVGLPVENTWTLIRALAVRYPVFYVTGNHEYWNGRVKEIKAQMVSYGVTVLEGTYNTILFQGQPLNLCGVDDPLVGERIWETQLKQSAAGADSAYFSILLTHRPERIAMYQDYDFDLILAGHAHGGQWRIPGLLNGFLAPNQGLFPAYAGGAYKSEECTMVVSRGLARESTSIPRIFNRPELVIIDVSPAE